MKLVKFFRNFNFNSLKIDLAIQGCFCPVFILKYYLYSHAFPGDAVVKNSPVSAGDTRDAGSIPGMGRCPEVGNDNTLQYSCLENSIGRGAWWATGHRVTEGWPRLSSRAHCNHTLFYLYDSCNLKSPRN